MSQELEELQTDEPSEFGRSLQARMRQRREQIESSTAEVFPVPGWEDIFAVRLRKVDTAKILRIEERHSRVRDRRLRNLYMNADSVVAGTDGFYNVADHDGDLPDPDTPTLEGVDWRTLARSADSRLAQDISPRQAVVSLLSDLQLGRLAREWMEWMERGRSDVEEELKTDFQATR